MTTNSASQPKLAQRYTELVTAIINLGEALLYEARFDDALALLGSDIVASLAKEFPLEQTVRIQVQRARIMRFKNRLGGGDNDATLELLFEAEKTARSLDNKSLLADVLNLIGLVFYDQELWVTTLETSLQYFGQACALKEKADDQRGIAESFFNIGTAHQNKKGRTDEDIERAFECFQKAYLLAQEDGFRWEQAHAARHLGYIYGHQKGEPDLALAHHQEFLVTNTELGFKPYLPPAHTRVGFTHLEMGNPDEAWEHFCTAQAMAEEIGYQAPLAEALFGLGIVLEKRGDVRTALERYEQARAVAQPINLIPVVRGASSRIAGLSKETDL